MKVFIIQILAALFVFGYLWNLVRSDLMYYAVTLLGGGVVAYLGSITTKKWWGGLPFIILVPFFFSFSRVEEGFVMVFIHREWATYWLKDVALPIYAGGFAASIFSTRYQVMKLLNIKITRT